MDTALFLTLFLFAVQIAAGVAPMIWPSRAWLARLIFWGSCIMALGCLVWWTHSSGGAVVASVRPPHIVAVVLVLLAAYLIWEDFRRQPATANAAKADAATRPDTRLRIRLDPAGTHYYLEVSQSNIDSWKQTLVQYSSQDNNGTTKVLHHNDTLALAFTVPVAHERPIIETFGHKLGGYNYFGLADKGAVFQFFDSIQAPVIEIWFPPPGYYEAQSKKASP